MTLTQIITLHDAAQAEYIAASRELATRLGSFEMHVLAETYRRDPELALRMADASVSNSPSRLGA